MKKKYNGSEMIFFLPHMDKNNWIFFPVKYITTAQKNYFCISGIPLPAGTDGHFKFSL